MRDGWQGEEKVRSHRLLSQPGEPPAALPKPPSGSARHRRIPRLLSLVSPRRDPGRQRFSATRPRGPGFCGADRQLQGERPATSIDPPTRPPPPYLAIPVRGDDTSEAELPPG